jgi:O-antigen ligase
MIALVAVATGNLSMLGFGSGSLLYDPMALPRLVVAAVLTCLAWALWAFGAARSGTKLRVDAVWALLMALAVWAGVSAALSPHRALAVLGQSERLEGVVTVALYALVYGVALQVVRHISDARRLAGALGIAAVILAIYGLLQFAGLDPGNYAHESFGFDTRRAFATFGNPNFFAGLLVVALPVASALALEAASRARKQFWAAGAIVVGAALFVTFTRGAWLAAASEVVAGVLVWRAWRGKIDVRVSRTAIVAVMLVSLGLVAVSLGSTGEINIAERISSAFNRTDSTGERALLVGVVADAAAERPLFGYGPDAFLPAFRAHRTDAYVEVFGETATVNNAHSWLLQYAVTLGIPGALLLASALALALVRNRPGAFTAGDSGPHAGGMLLTGVWIGCLGLTVHLAFNVGVLGATIPLFAMLGMLGAPRARNAATPASAHRVAGVVFMALTVLSVVASVALLRADASYLSSRQAFHGEIGGDSATLAREARDRNPLSVKYARGLAQEDARDVHSAIMREDSPESVRARYDVAYADFERVLAVSPNDYAALAWLSALQARVGTYLHEEALLSAAVTTAGKAAVLDRQHAEVRALAGGDTSASASSMAASVLPLP